MSSSISWLSVIGYLISHGVVVYSILNVPVTRNILNIMGLLSILSLFSLSAGYHRLWAHGSYKAMLPFRLVLLLLGSSCFVGSIINFSHYHRAHHQHIDTEKDPMNRKKGFLYSHIGWRCLNIPKSDDVSVHDLEADVLVNLQHKLYLIIALLTGLVFPAWLGFYLSRGEDITGYIVGFCYLGIGRIVLVQHLHFLTNSLCHTIGNQPFSESHTARDVPVVSLLTLGEGYQNFHHEFSKDYRGGYYFFSLDLTKFVIYILSWFFITYSLNTTSSVDILKARIQMKQEKLNRVKATLNFGPEEDQLPEESWTSIEARVAKGAKLIVVDGIVHDIGKFAKDHPGGARIIESRIGKDATLAFNGTVYRHSKAARNVAALMRVAKLPRSELHQKTQVDNSTIDPKWRADFNTLVQNTKKTD